MKPLHFMLYLSAMLHFSDGKVLKVSTTKLVNQHKIVNTHNELRRHVEPPATDMRKMVWSTEAARNANSVAKRCTNKHSLQKERQLTTTIKAQCGENIYMSSSEKDWSTVIKTWYSESEHFSYGIGASSSQNIIGHYTQIVWYSSYLIGCGVAFCKENRYKYLYICHYCPSGNLMHRINKPYTEGTPCFSCPQDCDEGLCKHHAGVNSKP
ncbi:cysteine-rich secretory protein 2-like [Ascaphus truei]|uniref:cysteine-rich secretory protein 2-like n=1 Tax=Ascaphus truei TaxID=8439 RepID=UPI003F5A560A